jgi:L-asparaginase type II
MSMLPQVRIVATGGTIANTAQGRIAVEQVLEDIRAWYPAGDPAQFARIAVTEILREGAETFTPDEWLAVSRTVNECVADANVDGVVVTHGTYTAEETAYFLHLAARSDKPVVVVCSQRKHGTIGNDGDWNLGDAVRIAGSPEAWGKGVLLVLNEEIHSAREVTKTNQRPGGFASGSLGILGSVESDRVSFYRQPTRRHTAASEFDVRDLRALPRVDVVPTYAGADGVAARAFVAAGARGLVISGFAYRGKPHRNQLPALQEAVEQGVAVVLTSRGGNGRVPVERGDGFVRGDNLSATKARILLMLALTRTADVVELQRIFDEY